MYVYADFNEGFQMLFRTTFARHRVLARSNDIIRQKIFCLTQLSPIYPENLLPFTPLLFASIPGLGRGFSAFHLSALPGDCRIRQKLFRILRY
jgi:hypothetical protein